MPSNPEQPEQYTDLEDESHLTEVFMMNQDERLAIMGPASAPLLRLAAIAAERVAKTDGDQARTAFFAGLAIGSVAQKILEGAGIERSQSIEDEFAAIEKAS